MAHATCPECYKRITMTATPERPHLVLACPHCQKRVMVTVQSRPGPQEFKHEMCTPAGRFLAEYDPENLTVTIPYRGRDYEFDLRTPLAWPSRLQESE